MVLIVLFVLQVLLVSNTGSRIALSLALVGAMGAVIGASVTMLQGEPGTGSDD